MMVLISVENLMTRESCEYEVSRVPCIGESVVKDNIDDEVVLQVVDVFHQLNSDEDNEPVAIVRVK